MKIHLPIMPAISNPFKLQDNQKTEKYNKTVFSLPIASNLWKTDLKSLEKVAYRIAILAPAIIAMAFDLTVGNIVRFTLDNLRISVHNFIANRKDHTILQKVGVAAGVAADGVVKVAKLPKAGLQKIHVIK